MLNLSYTRKHREKQNLSPFASLISTPTTGAFQLPAGARLYCKTVAGSTLGDLAVTVNSRQIKSPTLAAGEMFSLGWVDRGFTVTPQANFEIYVDRGLGRRSLIGSA